jgi:hypothetical protein
MKAIRLLFFWSISAMLAGCGCAGNEAAIESMRALSKVRLAALYRDVQIMDEARKGLGSITMSFPRDPVPPQIADLKPKSLEVDGDLSRLDISGCMDDKVLLLFEGLESKGRRKKIVLTLGEGKGSEILWEY